MRTVIIVLLLAAPTLANAQKISSKKKISYAQGTLFGYWGYNRSGYTRNDIRFVGQGYDFKLEGASASDNPEKFDASVYFNPAKITIPQFNARIGYYFRNYWAVSFGYDHMKYVFDDNNEVNLTGTIDPGVDDNWSGTYDKEAVITSREDFHYENSDGLNYLRAELTRTFLTARLGDKNQFQICTNLGASVGGLLSFNDFDFGGTKNMRTISLSGYGMSLHAGLRLEFFRHFFIQPNLGAGFHHQVKVKTRPNDIQSFARHAYGYMEFDTVFGFLIYIRPANACDSCPIW